MTATELPIIDQRPQLTHSSTAAYRTCHRRFWLAYVQKLRPAHDSDALRIGTAFHAGLEILKHGCAPDDAELVVRGMYADATCPPWLEAEDFAVEEETAVGMVLAYHHRYHADPILKYVAVELSFDLPIINPETGRETPSFRQAGKIDGIAELPDGRLAIVEHKTVGEDIGPGSDYWKRLLLDAQISRYYLAARMSGFDVQTVVYDCVRKPLIRPKAIAKADRALATQQANYHGVTLGATCPERETPKLYGARLLWDMTSRPDFYFSRSEIPRLDSDLIEYQRESWILQQQIRDAELKERSWGASAWPRNTGACTSPYRCAYLDICRGMVGDPNEQIPDGFKRVECVHPELVTTKEKA